MKGLQLGGGRMHERDRFDVEKQGPLPQLKRCDQGPQESFVGVWNRGKNKSKA